MTTDGADLTDAQKIEQLWERLDEANSEMASLRFIMEKKDKQIADLKAQVDAAQLVNVRMRDQVDTMAVELNKARTSAATAVQDYIANQR